MEEEEEAFSRSVGVFCGADARPLEGFGGVSWESLEASGSSANFTSSRSAAFSFCIPFVQSLHVVVVRRSAARIVLASVGCGSRIVYVPSESHGRKSLRSLVPSEGVGHEGRGRGERKEWWMW